MKKMITFTKYRYLAFGLSALLIIGSLVGLFTQGFTLGLDFQAGLSQQVQIADPLASIIYSGEESVELSVSGEQATLRIVSSNVSEELVYPFANYSTAEDLLLDIANYDGVQVVLSAAAAEQSANAIVVGVDFPALLSEDPITLHGRSSQGSITSEDIRLLLTDLDSGVSVQQVGNATYQEFLIRVGDPEGNRREELRDSMVEALGSAYGLDRVVVKSLTYSGPTVANLLASQSVILIVIALLLIMAYIWFRFEFAYSISAMAALVHDILIVLGFMIFARVELSVATVAAVLTIVGYSLNDTIVVFDRIRENRKALESHRLQGIIDLSINQSLSRTLVTSLTTMIAVVSIYFLASGSIKDFALNIIVGIIVGTYSSIFIASPVLLQISGRKEKGLEKPLKEVSAKDVATAEAATSAPEELNEEDDEKYKIVRVERKLKGKRNHKK